MPQSPPPATEDHLAQALRRALRQRLDDGQTIYQLSLASGVGQTALWEFYRGARATLRTDTASRLCAVLGLRLTAAKAAPPGRNISLKKTM